MCSNIGYSKEEQTNKAKKDNPKRMSKALNQAYINFLLGKGVCQVCEVSYDLDTPHHEPRGINKDDRYRVNICIDCHRKRHGSRKGSLDKSVERIERIAKLNYLEFLETMK